MKHESRGKVRAKWPWLLGLAALLITAMLVLVMFKSAQSGRSKGLNPLARLLFGRNEGTRFAPGYSDKAFYSIKLGDDEATVTNLLGAPLFTWTNDTQILGLTHIGQPLLQSFWGNGFLDSRHAGVPFRNTGPPVLHLNNPPGVTTADRRRELDMIQWMNRRQSDVLGDPEIASRIASYELAFRMQASVPALAELKDEPEHILKLYGADPAKPSFARNCLLARRLIERGVRFVQLYDRGWDSHTNIDMEHKRQCAAADQPTAALLADLKQRGLLEDTLVIWGGEFGYHTVENPIHVHDLHATILNQMGINHERLTFRTQGRDFRLTDVRGKVVKEIVA